jgi:hypothetical protein
LTGVQAAAAKPPPKSPLPPSMVRTYSGGCTGNLILEEPRVLRRTPRFGGRPCQHSVKADTSKVSLDILRISLKFPLPLVRPVGRLRFRRPILSWEVGVRADPSRLSVGPASGRLKNDYRKPRKYRKPVLEWTPWVRQQNGGQVGHRLVGCRPGMAWAARLSRPNRQKGSGKCGNPLGCRWNRCFGSAGPGAVGLAERCGNPLRPRSRRHLIAPPVQPLCCLTFGGCY